MAIFFTGLLTILLVLDCAVLIFLVLVQLPKKDAGAGLAFGGGAADALFGAGSGNVLTKLTKYAAAVFFVLALFLGVVEARMHSSDASGFEKALQQKQSQLPPGPAAMPPTTPVPAAMSSSNAPSTANPSEVSVPLVPAASSTTGTNVPAK